MSTLRTMGFGRLAFVIVVAAVTACSGLSLAGNGADDDADGAGGVDRADADDGADDAYSEDGAPPEDVAHEDGGPVDDADGATSGIIGIEPEGIEEYIVAADGETIRPHRHAVPAAFGDGTYGLVVDVEGTTGGLTIGLYLFDRDARELHRVWLDEPGTTTEYNSICWSGEAFVAALPTARVGLRVGAFGADGTLVREPAVLEPDVGYSPAGAGQPPTVLCGDEGPFVIDHGRGVGGTDRVYALAPDGGYGGTFADVDLPAFSTTAYYASTPCAAVGAEVACATPTGMVFVRRDGSHRLSDAVAAPGICPSGLGCDLARTADGLAAVWLAMATDSLVLTFARFAVDGSLDVPAVPGPSVQSMTSSGIRTASSGTTVLATAPSSDPDPLGPIYLYLFDTSGMPLGTPIPAGACGGSLPSDPDCPFPMGGSSTTPLFWEGDVYTALWVPEGPWAVGALAYRRFQLIER